MRVPFGLIWTRSDRVRFTTSEDSTHQLVVRDSGRLVLAHGTLLAVGVGIVTELKWLGPAELVIYVMSNVSFLALLFRVGGARALVGGLVLISAITCTPRSALRRSLHAKCRRR
jgi:hypothetical protein